MTHAMWVGMWPQSRSSGTLGSSRSPFGLVPRCALTPPNLPPAPPSLDLQQWVSLNQGNADIAGQLPYDGSIEKRSSKPRDVNSMAAAIVAQSTDPDDPGDDTCEGKNPAAVKLGRLGAKKGARLAPRSSRERSIQRPPRRLLRLAGQRAECANSPPAQASPLALHPDLGFAGPH
jgi:hypothetical protein